VPDRETKRARSRAAQLAAEARQRKEELRRRRRARIAAGIAILVGLAVLAVFVVALQTEEEPEAAAGRETPGSNPGCDGPPPPENDAKQYEQAPSPDEVLNARADYWATIETTCGTIEVDLLERKAPNTVANFVFLAEDGFYDGLTFHRVVNEFVIQGGDPKGDGSGDPGYEFDDELPKKSNAYTFGALAMANNGPNTQGSQFFFVTHDGKAALSGDKVDPAGLQALYSHFGEATEESYETLNTIQKVEVSQEPDSQDRPLTPVYINSITIEER
jgi:cyclophilin family peptidyl-prolyl cis-trans isomerase